MPKITTQLRPVIGMPYQGRVVGIYKDRRDRRDFNFLVEYDEDYRALTFWKRGIPTLDDYGPAVSPRISLLTQKYISDSNEDQLRNQYFFPKFEPEILSAIGVRIIFSDLQYSGLSYDTIKLKDGRALRAYFTHDPNIQGYFVNELIGSLEGNLQQKVIKTTEYLKSRKTAYVEAKLLGGITQDFQLGKWSKVTYLSRGFRVEAESEGTSLLVIPVEYSNCLKISKNTNYGKITVGATNLIQTGIIFRHKLDVNMRYSTSIFTNPICRLIDARLFKQNWLD